MTASSRQRQRDSDHEYISLQDENEDPFFGRNIYRLEKDTNKIIWNTVLIEKKQVFQQN